jgi:glutathione S-transferase
MKLYQFAYSPYAAKVRKCLELKRIAFETVEVPFMDRRELVAVTGGSVIIPVLVDGDTVVKDSPRITAWLDEHYGPSLRPGALCAAATALEHWSDQILEDVAFRLATPGIARQMPEWNGGRQDAAAMYVFIKERKFGLGCVDAWRAAEADLSTRLAALLAPLVRTLELQPFLLGDQPTVADAAVFGNFHMLETALPGRMRSIAPGMTAWFERVGRA